MPDDIPPQLRPALSQFQDALGALRTTRLRASQLTVPPMELPDPKLLERAATRPDAPAQLKALARAVAEGRTTWAEALSGQGLDVPEIRDLVSASGPRMAEKFAEAEAAEAAAAEVAGGASPPVAGPATPPVQPRRGRPANWDEDDLGNESYLY